MSAAPILHPNSKPRPGPPPAAWDSQARIRLSGTTARLHNNSSSSSKDKPATEVCFRLKNHLNECCWMCELHLTASGTAGSSWLWLGRTAVQSSMPRPDSTPATCDSQHHQTMTPLIGPATAALTSMQQYSRPELLHTTLLEFSDTIFTLTYCSRHAALAANSSSSRIASSINETSSSTSPHWKCVSARSPTVHVPLPHPTSPWAI